MALILNIDTSTEHASICLAENDNCLWDSTNSQQKEHASWLHPAIKSALDNCNKKPTDLDAIGVTAGPGSYTGLRVGLATAKGLCYALNKPLIAVNTLEAMASMATREETDLICPMIDARRMEVFTALYDKNLSAVIAPSAVILDKDSFSDVLEEKRVLFFGNGKNKFENLIDKQNAIFKNLVFNAIYLSVFTYRRYKKSKFNTLAETQPLYLKEYYTLYIDKS